MALINCNECSKQVSDQAEVCPHCGFRLKSATTVKYQEDNSSAKGCLILIVLGFVFWAISYYTSNSTPERAPAENRQASETKVPTLKYGANWTEIHNQGMMHFVFIKPDFLKDEDQYRDAVVEICGVENVCHVLFWSDESKVPRSMPMTDAQLDAQVAKWSANNNTGYRQWLWKCDVVGKTEDCL